MTLGTKVKMKDIELRSRIFQVQSALQGIQGKVE